MRLLSFATNSQTGRAEHLGALAAGDADSGELIDLTAASRALLAHEGAAPNGAERLATALVPGSLLGFIQGGPRSRDLAESAFAAAIEHGWETDPLGASIRYRTEAVLNRPAITEPPMLRDFMAFEKHLLNVFPKLGREIPEQWYERPVYYKANTASIGAHEQEIEFPVYAEQLDLEFEFAAILGRGGVNIPHEQADTHIFGYTVYNDFSARAVQSLEMTVGLGPAKGKDFVAAHVLGPVVVTADELGDPYALAMRARVNGEQWTDGATADMHWTFADMIAYASQDEPLRAGEVFGSGTVGDGSGAEQGKWLEPGDLVELQIDGIGVLRNKVVTRGCTTQGKRKGER